MATKEQVFQFAREEAARQGVSPDLIERMVRQESQGNINAKSKKGARGPMQLMPATAKEMGVNINDWQDNIRGGVRYVNQLLQRFDDPALAVAAYNAGPTAVRRAGGVPEFKETQNYVQKVLGGNMVREVDPKDLGLDFTAQPTAAQQTAQAGSVREIDTKDLKLDFGKQKTDRTGASPYSLREVGRQVGLTGRYALEGLVGQTLDIGGAPLANLFRMAGMQVDTPSQSMSRLATTLGLPQPQGRLEESVGQITRAGFSAAPNVAAGRLLAGAATTAPAARTGTQAVGQALQQSPGAQLAGVAAGTAASEVARQGFDVTNPFALGAINLAAGVPTASAVSRLSGGQPMTQAGQLVESGRARGVNLTAADVAGGSATQRSLRKMAGTSEKLAQERTSEIERLINRTADDIKPSSVKAGNEARVVAQDLRSQYKNAKDAVAQKFTRAEQLAGNQKISLDNTAAASNEVGANFPVTAETNVLRRQLDRLENFVATGGGTYKEIRDLQKNIGSELERVRAGLATGAYSPSQESALSRLYGSMSQDVDNWAAPRVVNGKQVFTPAGAAHARAMEQFRQTVVPFRQDPDIYRLVSSRTTNVDYDRAAETFNRKLTNNVETADLAMNLMSPKGQQAAQYSVVNDARAAGMRIDPTNPSVPGFVSKLNLGIPDNPTPQRVILSKTPGLIDELSTVRDIANTAQPGMRSQADTLLPEWVTSAGRMTPAVPTAARFADEILSSPAATRYMLTPPVPATGLTLGAAQQQATPLATMPEEESFRPAYNLFDFVGQTFGNQ